MSDKQEEYCLLECDVTPYSTVGTDMLEESIASIFRSVLTETYVLLEAWLYLRFGTKWSWPRLLPGGTEENHEESQFG
jgi:hypothetical protein